MGKLYIVCNSYNPNTASANRLLSFVQGFSELGVEAEVVFLVPNSDMSKVPYGLLRRLLKDTKS